MLVVWYNEGHFCLVCLFATLPSVKYSKTVAQKCATNIPSDTFPCYATRRSKFHCVSNTLVVTNHLALSPKPINEDINQTKTKLK